MDNNPKRTDKKKFFDDFTADINTTKKWLKDFFVGLISFSDDLAKDENEQSIFDETSEKDPGQHPLELDIIDVSDNYDLGELIDKAKNTDEKPIEFKPAKKREEIILPPPEERAESSEIVDYDNYIGFGVKIKGYSHFVNPSNCQDAFCVEKVGNSVIIAVADGHGSKKHYLSEFGAAIAVETTTDILKDMLKTFDGDNTDSAFNYIKENFPTELYDEWNRRVQAHSETRDDITLPATESDIRVIYGTTAMFIVSIGENFFYGKLDGDILVYKDGEYSSPPESDELYGTDAYSLCNESNAKTKWVTDAVTNPEFIAITTDGFRNACSSYSELEPFINGVEVVRSHTVKYGPEQAKRVLPEYLCRLSDGGSADDITFACVIKKEDLENQLQSEEISNE
jgi:serine/threonine protein phosphatase PrpC